MGSEIEKHPLIEKEQLKFLAWEISGKFICRNIKKCYHRCQKTRLSHSLRINLEKVELLVSSNKQSFPPVMWKDSRF